MVSIGSILSVDRTGIYGHSRVCAWAIEEGVVGYSTSPGRRWAWQTRAWSYGARESSAVLFQDVIDTPSNPGPLVGGTRVNVNEVLAADFGQWDLDRSSLTGIPRFDESTEIRSPYYGSRRGTDVCGSCCTPRTETVRPHVIWPATSQTTRTKFHTITPLTTTGVCTTWWTRATTRIRFFSLVTRSPSTWLSLVPGRTGRGRPGSPLCDTASMSLPKLRFAMRDATGCNHG
jgi:hypothetical protein